MAVCLRVLIMVVLLAAPGLAGSGHGPQVEDVGGVELGFRSELEGYQAYVPQPVAPWRSSNDRVGEIGGWRTYAREAWSPADEEGREASDPAPGHAHGHEEAP